MLGWPLTLTLHHPLTIGAGVKMSNRFTALKSATRQALEVKATLKDGGKYFQKYWSEIGPGFCRTQTKISRVMTQWYPLLVRDLQNLWNLQLISSSEASLVRGRFFHTRPIKWKEMASDEWILLSKVPGNQNRDKRELEKGALNGERVPSAILLFEDRKASAC